MSNCERKVVVSSTDRLGVQDAIIVHKVLIGCTKYIYRVIGPEENWIHDLRKVKLTQVNGIITVVDKSDLPPQFSPHLIETKYSEEIKKTDHTTASRALKMAANVNIIRSLDNSELRNSPGRPVKNDDNKKAPGIQRFYSKPNDESLDRVLSNDTYRELIFRFLKEADVLQQYFKYIYYKEMIFHKYFSIDQLMEIEKIRGSKSQSSLTQLKDVFVKEKILAERASDEEIMAKASRLAKNYILNTDGGMNDKYTYFYKKGHEVYSTIEDSNFQIYE